MCRPVSLLAALCAVVCALLVTPAIAVHLPVAPRPPHTLILLDRQLCEPGWLVTLASLQGVIARTGGTRQLYLTQRGSGHDVWPRFLAEQHSLEVVRARSAEAVFRELARHARGFVTYDPRRPESITSATMLAAVHDAVLVDGVRAEAAIAAGLKSVGAGSDVSPADVLSENRTNLNVAAIAEQNPDRQWALRDLLVMGRVPVLFGGGFETVADQHDRPMFGWGKSTKSEREFISRNSRLGLFTIPSDHATNLSVLGAFPQSHPLRQKPTADVVADSKVHLVTFVLTDGDNAGWVLGDFSTNSRWFGSPARGKVPMGYGVPPSLVELAPDVLRWLYEQAARNGSAADAFIVGPSGGGYFYPSLYPPNALAEHIDRLSGWMAKADLHLVQIIDTEAFERADLWAQYLRRPEIDGLVYLEYSRYNKLRGRVLWVEGKPVVAARHLLWARMRGADAESVVSELNAAPRDLTSSESYSIVGVHAWSQTLADVQAVVARLGPSVRVVTPDLFFSTLRGRVRR